MILATGFVSLGGSASAAVYPCGSDPGFCYRDLGNDGCYDAGTDVPSIDAWIETSKVPVPPTPGSIVCPPSVSELVPTEAPPGPNIYLSTSPGSDILFYSARISAVGLFDLNAGRDLLLGGLVKVNFAGGVHVGLTASGDISLEKGILGMKAQTGIDVTSTGGDVTIGSKAKFKSSRLTVSAAGNITLENKVVAKVPIGGDIDLSAGGALDLTNPRLTSIANGSDAQVLLIGSDVTVNGKARIVTKTTGTASARIEITATSGDVEVDRLVATTNTDVLISGQDVSIGLPDAKGLIRKSRITQKNPTQSTQISASGTIALARMQLTTAGDATVTTSGTTVDFTEGTIKGIKGVPTVTVSAGPGSVCDLTGTVVKSANLVTSCDSVVGP